MASQVHMVAIDKEDLDAYVRELVGIYRQFGVTADECQPHLRKRRQARIDRAGETFRACILTGADLDGG